MRNFACCDRLDCLEEFCGGSITVVHGVLGIAQDEQGELDRVLAALQRESASAQLGSPEQSALAAAESALATVCSPHRNVSILELSARETTVALELMSAERRSWRQQLGMRRRRLHSGEAASVAVAVTRSLSFASDDDDARIAYEALDGTQHLWTRDVLKGCAAQQLLTENEARRAYESLLTTYRFYGIPWDAT